MKKYSADDFTWLQLPKTNGTNITAARSTLGFSQHELADKVGVKLRQVQRWEKEISRPSKSTTARLDALFGKDWKLKR